jgi:hypothetical protein
MVGEYHQDRERVHAAACARLHLMIENAHSAPLGRRPLT